MEHVNKEKVGNSIENWSFTYVNYWLFFIGIVFIITGYVLMHAGGVNSFQSLTLAPILLFIGYLFIIPFALIYQDKVEK